MNNKRIEILSLDAIAMSNLTYSLEFIYLKANNQIFTD